MKDSVKGDILREILALPLASEFPLRLTHQIEWHEFTPLAFLLVRSLRPQRILEVGTTIGDSYLSFCQAVQLCNLPTECLCIPRSETTCSRETVSRQLQEFRAYHDALYAKFSKIDPEVISLPSAHGDRHGFNLIHIISSESAGNLGDVCSTWLPRLTVSGVALISGQGRFEQSGLKPALERVSSLYCTRVLQMTHWLIILSRKPIGIVHDLLLCSQEEFLPVAKLLKLLGDHVRLENALRREVGESEQQRAMSDQLRSDVGNLRRKLATIEEEEMEAQIRFAQTDLRLEQAWSQKEMLSKRLELIGSEDKPSTTKEETRSSGGSDSVFDGAKEILRQLKQHHTGEYELSTPAGKQLWDECGLSVLRSILDRQTRLTFPEPLHPSVSVIVVLRNKIHLSVLSLAALLLQTDACYELIVVDNGSSDETAHVLSLVDNATVITNFDNMGFGPACMQASYQASGEFLCFLNNDAVLQPGSLAPSLEVFADNPDAGVVGGKILLADGRLQEAGCIVWRDGRTHQYGRGDDPFLPQYSFRRPVDYCSGVFLVTPRELFEKVGGFDKRYAPAYYEDVDYCMQMWEQKKQVLYEPRSLVHHYENASSPDMAAALEKIRTNHQQFMGRWSSALLAHQVERAENVVRGRISTHARARRCVFFFGDLSATLAEFGMDARLRHVWSLREDDYLVTCMLTNPGGCLEASRYFPHNVELRDLNAIEVSELHQYCDASDVIILAELQNTTEEISTILNTYSDKVTGLAACLHGITRKDALPSER